MTDKAFLDTNILIYVYSVDEKEKQAKATELIEMNRNVLLISNQVINELCNTLFKKFSKSLRKLLMFLLSLVVHYLSLSLAYKRKLKLLD